MCEDWDCTCPPGTNTATEAETSKPCTNSYPSNNWNNDSNWRKNEQREQFGTRQFSNNKYSNNRPNRNNQRGYDPNQQKGFDRDQNQHRGFDREQNHRNFDRDQNQRGNDRDQNQRSYGRGQNQNGSENNENTLVDTIKVSSKYVGRIIGRGGSKISDLQFESSARINVLKETEGDQTFIKISGTQESIDKAKELINDLTVDRNQYSNRSTENQFSNRSNDSFSKSNDTSNVFHEEPAAPEERQKFNFSELLKQDDERAAKEWATYPEVQKVFYQEHPEVTAMTDEEVNQFRASYKDIQVSRTDDKPIPKPCITFEHAFHNYPEILEEIRKVGFEKPSPIQCQAWPVIMSGEDLIGIAQTGTGKTLAFLLPALLHIEGQLTTREERMGPVVLVMAPTRELALQIDKEVKKYEYRGINSICIYGGGNRREQIQYITEGVDIVIATPGRLNDLMVAGHLNIKYVTYCVLDEADRMLDLGFEPQIRKVMYQVRPSRQTIMTSATWPTGVRRLAESYMVNPVHVHIGTLDLKATHTVKQIIEILPDDEDEKFRTFMEFVHDLGPDDKIIVFCGKKARADHISSELVLAGIDCQSIHGDRDQSDREQALLDIADGTVRILIATDVASRGLDINDITHVLNYDFPRNIDEYVHRIGRTGRAEKTGISISYVTRSDWGVAGELIKILEEAQQHVPEEIYSMAERYSVWREKKDAEDRRGGGRHGGGRGGGGRRW